MIKTRILIAALACGWGCGPAKSDTVSAPVSSPELLSSPVESEEKVAVATAPDSGNASERASWSQEIRDRLPGQTIGLLLDGDGLLAVGHTGQKIRVIEGDFSIMHVDHIARAIWLDGTYARKVRPGLYVGDLESEVLQPAFVTRLMVSSEIVATLNGRSHLIGKDAENPSLALAIDSSGPRVHSNSGKGCDFDGACSIDDDGRIAITALYLERELVYSNAMRTPSASDYKIIRAKATCNGCGRYTPIPKSEIGLLSVRTRGHSEHILWVLYDPITDEYVSANDPSLRSHKKFKNGFEAHLVQTVFSCNPGDALIINGIFVTPTLDVIHSAARTAFMGCLDGGWRFDSYEVKKDG